MKKTLVLTIATVGIFFAAFRLLPGQAPAQVTNPATTGRAQPDAENVRLIGPLDGPALYKAYCAVCHGIDGHGTGPIASTLKAAPADLTKIAARNGGIFPAKKVEKVIAGEEQRGFEHGTKEMPLWGPVFSQVAWDRDLGLIRIHNLASYLEKMQAR